MLSADRDEQSGNLLRLVGLPSRTVVDDWSDEELSLIIGDYFSTLEAEQRGERYNKTEHRRRLISRLRNRTELSIELEHCKISAVLEELGLPFLPDYKPRANFQAALRDAVEEFLATHKQMLDAVSSKGIDGSAETTIPADLQIEAVLEDPPPGSGLSEISRRKRVVHTIGLRATQTIVRLASPEKSSSKSWRDVT